VTTEMCRINFLMCENVTAVFQTLVFMNASLTVTSHITCLALNNNITMLIFPFGDVKET